MTSSKNTSLDMSDQFKEALHIMESGRDNLFVTGKAGTGKSTLLTYFRDHTQKRFVILAPTGVAAVNIGGQTIHSFFKFRPDVTPDRVRRRGSPNSKKKTIYQKLEVLIIDEISMVRADLMDCIEKFLRLNGPIPGEPFGGVQIILFGDLYQLPPVIRKEDWEILREHYPSPHFFQAQCLKNLPLHMVELDHIYRQKDPVFIDLLNKIRSGLITLPEIEQLNASCYKTDNSHNSAEDQNEFRITLTSTNKAADALNDENLEDIEEKYHLFDGELTGEFKNDSLPSPELLKLKKHAQVMLTNNDPKQRWINGTMAKILRIGQSEDYETFIRVELESGKRVSVYPAKWEMTKYVAEGETFSTEVIGTYTQFPVKLAWAITIHKSQGKTFDHVDIDLGRSSFAPGQTYVALSRCRSLEGIRLMQPMTMRHIISDKAVTTYLVNLELQQASERLNTNEKMYALADAIENSQNVIIDYIRQNGEKSTRSIEPQEFGSFSKGDNDFPTLKAYCHTASKQMVFALDQILSIKTVS